MKLTFTNVHWRNSDDSDVFNMHAINSIELDMDNDIVTINCVTNTYKSPFCDFTYGGGFTHFEFTAMDPYDSSNYINIAIFERTSKVCVASHCGKVALWFENKCKNFAI